jgi:uncharacterized membrane protein (DUF2068 family)
MTGTSGERSPPTALGLRIIVAYKLAKAIAEALVAVALVALVAAGAAHRAHDAVEVLRQHVVHAWSIALTDLLLRALTTRRLYFTAAAIALDALLSAVEGWCLRRGYRWAPWLVVGASASLMPFEVVQIARRPHVGRFVILAVNAVIVVYLVRRTREGP